MQVISNIVGGGFNPRPLAKSYLRVRIQLLD